MHIGAIDCTAAVLPAERNFERKLPSTLLLLLLLLLFLLPLLLMLLLLSLSESKVSKIFLKVVVAAADPVNRSEELSTLLSSPTSAATFSA
jgi:hypothetical protein